MADLTVLDTFWIILHTPSGAAVEVVMVVPTLAMAKHVAQTHVYGTLEWTQITRTGSSDPVEQAVTSYNDVWTLWPAMLAQSADYVA